MFHRQVTRSVCLPAVSVVTNTVRGGEGQFGLVRPVGRRNRKEAGSRANQEKGEAGRAGVERAYVPWPPRKKPGRWRWVRRPPRG